MRKGVSFTVSAADRRRLREVMSDGNSLQKHVWRAHIVLLSAAGLSVAGLGTMAIMTKTGKSKTCVWRWQERFMREGVDGLLRDKTRPPGKTPIAPERVAEIVRLTHTPPPGEAIPMEVRAALTSHDTNGKTAIVGIKDRDTNEVRAEVVTNTDAANLQGFVREHTEPGAALYTDEAAACRGMPEFDHEAVNHSVGEYVDGMAPTNRIESFWSRLKRAHKGTFHKMSLKHLQRYVSEFAGKHNIRNSGLLAQMRDTVARLVGRNLLYGDLIVDYGLSSGARS